MSVRTRSQPVGTSVALLLHQRLRPTQQPLQFARLASTVPFCFTLVAKLCCGKLLADHPVSVSRTASDVVPPVLVSTSVLSDVVPPVLVATSALSVQVSSVQVVMVRLVQGSWRSCRC